MLLSGILSFFFGADGVVKSVMESYPEVDLTWCLKGYCTLRME